MNPALLAVLSTAVAPVFWGTTYIVFTQTLPIEHPLLVAALRALPAGILLMLAGAGLPPRDKLLPLAVLGFANIGFFFALLFFSASRLPGGIAATLSSAQPLIVTFLAWPLLSRRPAPVQIAAAFAGMIGVALLVLDPNARPDFMGALAALGASASMAVGTVLTERWGRMGTALQLAAWQLTLGGALLIPVALAMEGLPPVPEPQNLLGMTYLVLVGTALAYWLWVRGISRLGANVAFLGLISPIVATLLGAAMLGEFLTVLQALGIALALGSCFVGTMFAKRPRPSK
ncbi:ABC transporter permease [Agaricicola taiwanensis]|uniref:ABC transporter permease n=1 Tax=Agaricicola taiwanensis TaxID=591372 RepID=A0A8J2VXA9_9RHOB|nr:DMT family transporter [Agaricicola taiwanensis]GGE38370.1 ABC transporter permease [Agaricicola taiwanensis]